ncbi:uncharacterized protein VDAG_06860 [Verticillium dahliae VdLs.17]|uniref:Uncharacterized protein n=1 Tax=Verticillium dahliae (strain VdLs.17 / ATCC MYA-4575 / FGSC 10137) TaxID=498257 RepID=G2X9M8_VERDV|nr:uncharacterized protein VDAG_06860 [Verticillium dahliae VdLs.17]EGY15696.1 hypothetical protein VDAG_06860 [Verticillium dahliae VdLs.17]
MICRCTLSAYSRALIGQAPAPNRQITTLAPHHGAYISPPPGDNLPPLAMVAVIALACPARLAAIPVRPPQMLQRPTNGGRHAVRPMALKPATAHGDQRGSSLSPPP